MRNSIVIILAVCLSLSSCGQAKQETNRNDYTLKAKSLQTSDEEELKKLVFKTELNEAERTFIEERAKGFDERVKQYAINFGPKSTPEDSKKKSEEMCEWILNNVKELSTQPISRERERERETDFYYKAACEPKIDKSFYSIPKGYWELVEEKIPSSAQPDIDKAVKALGEESSKGNFVYSLKHYLKLKQAIAKDQKDLMGYQMIVSWYQDGLEDKTGKDLIQEDYKEYCRKAVELKQWDHIYYLSKGEPSGMTRGIEYIVSCLETKHDEYNYKYCKCPEATRMVVGQWPKSALYDGYILDPSGEDGNGNLREGAKEWMNELMKKHFGRDLTKEK